MYYLFTYFWRLRGNIFCCTKFLTFSACLDDDDYKIYLVEQWICSVFYRVFNMTNTSRTHITNKLGHKPSGWKSSICPYVSQIQVHSISPLTSDKRRHETLVVVNPFTFPNYGTIWRNIINDLRENVIGVGMLVEWNFRNGRTLRKKL